MAGISPSDLLQHLRRFGLENDRLDAAVARELGASPVEFKAMDHLHAAGELTPGVLADKLGLTSGAITALVDRLERLGWAFREPHPSDRRSLLIRPTHETRSIAERFYAPYAAGVERAARELSPAERDAAARFLAAAAGAAAAQAERGK